jgi:hypothetical protein
MSVPFLTQPELAKAQAEVEGFQSGPLPVLNPANLNTQQKIGNPQVVADLTPTIPYYPEVNVTPNLQLALDNMSAETAQNFIILDNAVGTTGLYDAVDNLTGQLFSYQPLISGLFNIVIVATSINPPGPYLPAQVNFNVSYTDNAGPEFNDGVVVITDNNQPASINEAIFATIAAPITINSSYVTFGIAGALPANAWSCPVTVTGPGAAYGATLTQSNPNGGCTARFYGVVSLGGVAGQLLYTVLTGTDDFDTTGPVFIDAVSGTHYTAAGAKAVGTFTGPGFGVDMVQFVTGAFGPEMDPASGPTTVMHLGPQLSGVPNLPSGRIIVAGPAPSLTQNYAWYDPVNGGVFVPTNPWTDVATRIVFPYNFHIRVLQIG